MTTEDIIRELELGNDVTLDSSQIYDFTDKHSIKIKGTLNGNGSLIVANNLFQSQGLRFLFLLDKGTIKNLNIVGPNGEIGPSNRSHYWGAVNIISSGNIINCNFRDCDKWAIKCTSKKALVEKMFIDNCTFNNIRRSGFGYAIWNQYGDVTITNCKFSNCRHGVDGSSSVFKTRIEDCQFDESNFIHINMHGDDDQIRGGANCEIDNCNFYDYQTPLELKLPTTSTGITSVTNCNFLVSEDKVGNIVHDEKITKFVDPQFRFENNTFNGEGLLTVPEIKGPDKVYIGEKVTFETFDYPQYNWLGVVTNEKSITQVFHSPEVLVIDVYGIKGNYRSIKTYKKVEVIDPNNFCFSVFLKGFGCTVEIYRDNVLVNTILPTQLEDWYHYKNYINGNYRVLVKGTGTIFIDDWLEGNFSTTFEDKLEVKLKYYLDGKSIGAGLFDGEKRTGKSCLRLTLPTQNSKIEVYVDK